MSKHEFSEAPVFRDGVIHWGDEQYSPWLGGAEEEYIPEGIHPIFPEPKPGEVPRPIRGGFFWCNTPFLPDDLHDTEMDADIAAREIVREAQRQARVERISERFAPTVPPEFESEIAERHANNQSPREIAKWLKDEKGIDTSHASVGRAIKRYHRKRLLAQGASATMQRIEDRREDLDRVLEDMDRLRQCAIDDIVAGHILDRAIEVSFRMARQQAMVIQRDLQDASRSLATEQRDALRAERFLAEQAALDPPEPSTAHSANVRPAKSDLLTGLAGLAVALFITLGSWSSGALAKSPSYAAERVREPDSARPALRCATPWHAGSMAVERSERWSPKGFPKSSAGEQPRMRHEREAAASA